MKTLISVSVTSCLLGVSLAFAVASDSLSASDDICHGLDCPKFTVLNKTADWELRRYGPTKWATTNMTAMNKDDVNSDMFHLLFLYITGANAQKAKIPMTAPVVTKVIHGQGPNCESDFVMGFMIPHNDWDSPIPPTDPKVYIEVLPAMDVYVRAFGGFASDADYMENLQELTKSLGVNVNVEEKYFFTAGYDGPYQFSHRRNEVWLVKQ